MERITQEEYIKRYGTAGLSAFTIPPQKSTIEKAGSMALGAGKGFIEGAVGTASILQDVGQGVLAVGQGALDPNKTIGETWKELQSSTGFQSLEGEQKREINEMLKAQNPDEKTGKVLGFIGEILAGGVPVAGKFAVRKAGQFGDILKQSVKKSIETISKATSKATESPKVSGVVQTVKDLASRVPRFSGRVKEGAEEAAVRAEKIRTSPPTIGQALKVNLPEEYINFAKEIDEPTRKASLRVLDMADAPKTIGKKTNPGIVGGELAGKQYDIIEKQRKLIGKQIGEQIDTLSKTTQVPMETSHQILENVLSKQGISTIIDEKGVRLDFSSTRFTPAERTRIKELYSLAIEGGSNLTPRQIHGKDQLFSKLQREARFEGVGDIRVETPQGNMSLFRVFRNVYSNKLEEIAPAIKPLNKDYAKLTSLVDDIEDSIIKTPNFNATKSADAAEFAKVNLRRIFGEAQSSPAYEKIADEMDALARTLGYADASPKDIAAFAESIRKLYPDIIPKAGFQGGIRAGISDIIETVSKIGAPNQKDQQKALRALLNQSFKK